MRVKPLICGIVAIGPDNVIGHNGIMPWYSKQDFYHFKTTTMSYPCVFGRNTYENMPKKPLPGRLNIVCSSQFNNEYKDNVFYAKSMDAAMRAGAGFKQIFICGGSQIYKYALDNNIMDIMYLTKIHDENLAAQIKLNPSGYSRFPIKVDEFFDPKKWQTEPTVYTNGILPMETNPVFCEFFKCIRVK